MSHHSRVDGVDLHWKEVGAGRPLVLLHGLSDSHLTWSKVAPLLGRSHRVLMPDLAGHGLSGRPDTSYALEWHARVIGRWLESLGLDEVDLVGHSFGGGVAQWMLLEYRARIRRLGLISAGGLGREVGLPLRLASIPGVLELLGQPFMAPGTFLALQAAGGGFAWNEIALQSKMNAIPGSARALARSIRDVIDWRGQRRHFLDRAHEVERLPPVALFWGERDTVIPVAHATQATSILQGATATFFEGCGHFPHRQRPEQFVSALDAFIDAPTLPNARLLGVAVPGPRAVGREPDFKSGQPGSVEASSPASRSRSPVPSAG